MLYFSYGSNMSIKRLSTRIPSAKLITIAVLPGHELKFHKVGKDGSGKCDIFPTDKPDSGVIGVVFDIHPLEKVELDRKEGLGSGYEEKMVRVITMNGDRLMASSYYATKTESSIKPFRWYLEHVIRGARENGLPKYYIQALQEQESVADPDIKRYEAEMAIYHQLS